MPEELRSLLTRTLPIVDGVHVAVPDDAHVGNFSHEWTKWSTTQLDSRGYRCGYPGCRNSADAFTQKTGLSAEDLVGHVVVDAGCGSGRYSEIAAAMGSRLVAVDLSSAVFQAAKLAPEWTGDSLFVKANVERLPIKDSSADAIFSIGVIHHCGNPALALREMARVLRPGGIFAGWVYGRQKTYESSARSLWRSWSSKASNRVAMTEFASAAPSLRDVLASGDVNAARRAVCEIGKRVPMLPTLFASVSIRDFAEIVGVSGSRNDEECMLDTFDWSTPTYQWQYTREEWSSMLAAAGFGSPTWLRFPVSWKVIK